MKLYKSFFYLSLLFFVGCTQDKIEEAKKDKKLISYVNPFIGTGGHGHTYPGATMPFGMMQLSPDTRLDGWDGCSGYHYSDTEIYGFSHTHLSGTGVSDYGDILLMPTNKLIFNNGADGKEGYKSKFSHENEEAEPGFYKVHLDDTNIDVALTLSKRSGMHQYNFPASDNQFVILDLVHRDKVLDAKINRISDTELTGYRFSEAWATDQRLFFAIETSHSFTDVLQSPPKKGLAGAQKIALNFINPNNEPVSIKIGISAVDIEGAKKNLEAEIGNQTFEEVKKTAQDFWEKQLEKIVVEDTNEDHKVNFYTSMYHVSIAPNLYQDVDGRYRGMDMKIHETKDFDYYTVFSLWDTYRAAHPLYTIIEQEKTNDFINTFLAKYDEGGIMPIWDLAANYTGCMIGYHAVPVIADAYLKGIRSYDVEKAFKAMKHSATRDKLGLDSYKNFGFIPVEKESESVSKTLEYAYDDWTIAQMAKSLGKEDDYKMYSERAQYYKNVFDPESQFMRGRFRNTWFAPFDPYEVNFNYTEANSWQYSFYVPQDITGFTKLLGGKAQLENQLDKLFTAEDKTSGSHQVDITGLIGQYAHGNEPSHHMAYLYNFVNKPGKTQEKVRQILTELYTNTPDGISGNEDCGQMSAWYIFSSLGFYPVTPGSNQYIIGSPLFEKATINLESGKSFTVEAKNQSEENKYIKSVKLNGENYEYSFINHSDIMNGGNLVFEMTNEPSNWGTKDKFIPSTKIDEHVIVASPFIAKGAIAFKGSTEVSLGNVDKEASVYYRLGSKGGFKKYEKPLTIAKFMNLAVYAEKAGIKSKTITTDFYKIDPNLKIDLLSDYANQYNAGGNNALIDGILGTEDFRTGTWQGYFDTDLVAVVDLGSQKEINEVSVSFLQDQRSWIFYPTEVTCLISSDNKNFEVGYYRIDNTTESDEVKIREIKIPFENKNIRYIKIIAKKLGKLPAWHLGYKHDGRSWLFVDEIQIK
ncbi:GH92 family glycosyl hydrolase [Polaribacter litorisediminis]|uniref:GH92 family glycosyl hydrolase n=1 Tax=Polaribacter litorisediminis TaxID=1908341 RepID=UPI001CC167CD|nr:GH92 family glycosyl hydrolase [Polaribacter litorisediminis]UAM99027.1 GH92 family glycosyl hydrolase [Polaribacter litorisediminis]